jgi:hypothetical protein
MRPHVTSLAFILSATVLSLPAFADKRHGNDDSKPAVYLDRPLTSSAEDTCTPGFLWQGAGNPNATFQRKRNVDAGLELGIKGIIRQGPDIRSTYVDDDGLVHIEVPAGAQPGNPARAAWNFTYSFDVSLDSGNPALDKYDAELWIDLDPSEKTEYLKLDLVRLGSRLQLGHARVSRTPMAMAGRRRTRSSFLTTRAPTASHRTRRTLRFMPRRSTPIRECGAFSLTRSDRGSSMWC